MMRMASPMSAARSLSVSLFARARVFAAMIVPGVVASSEGFAFFDLLTPRKCIRHVRASTATTRKASRKVTRANVRGDG